MKYLVVFLVLLAGLWLYVRFAPSDAERWHVDPATAGAPPNGSFRASIEIALPPEAALTAFQLVALQAPRTTVLVGRPQDGRITFVTRSRVWGFPDYTTVAATPAPDGSYLTVLARLRFGSADLGVNRARVEAWLQPLHTRGG